MKYDRKNVGVVGYWYATNYGGVSSYYSLCRTIERLGYKPFLVESITSGQTEREQLGTFPRRFFNHVNIPISDYYSKEELYRLNEIADNFVLGSDQVLTKIAIQVFGKQFLMEFADDSKKKIAISASCGGEKIEPPEVGDYAAKQVLRMNSFSVRETTAQPIIKEKFGFTPEVIIDPIFYTSAEEYRKVAKLSDEDTGSGYLLAYILDPTEDKKKCIEKIAQTMGLPIKVILDGRKGTYEKNVPLMNMGSAVLPQLEYKEWLKYYSNAGYVITDSFHGVCMSLIMNKPFIIYANHRRGYPRFVSLCEIFGIKERLIEKFDELNDDLITSNLNFARLDGIKISQVNHSVSWLKTAFEKKIDDRIANIAKPSNKTVTAILPRVKCTGCGACVNVCPKDALSLKPDALGFYVPALNLDKCINCGLCAERCTALHLPEKRNRKEPKLFEFVASDKDLLEKSSSGGIFGLMAEQVLSRGGVVAGAAWANDFSVEHIIIDSIGDLSKLQKSKYLQSCVGTVFRDVKKHLETGRLVLFSGCPCQVAGLKAFLQKDYDNLILIDLLCGNSPSAGFFKKYLKDEFPQGVKKYTFRHKIQGWNANCVTVTVTVTDGTSFVRSGGADDGYQRLYHAHVLCPPHCENCVYQAAPRYGDITIGDFWGVNKHDPAVATKQGISAVLLNNENGEKWFGSLSSGKIAVKKQVPFAWLGGNGYARGNKNWASPKRDEFFKAITELKMGFTDAANYALKPNHGKPLFRHNQERLPMLDFDTRCSHFSFDRSVWEEHQIDGVLTLIMKQNKSKASKFATLPLAKNLQKGKRYILSLKFRANTDSDVLNFYLKDSGTDFNQVIYSHKVGNTRNQWVELRREFVPKQSYYDQLMISAAQITGLNAFCQIAYVNIIQAYGLIDALGMIDGGEQASQGKYMLAPKKVEAFLSARIDVKLSGENAGFELVGVSDKNATSSIPAWFQKSGKGYVVESSAGCVSLTFKVTTDGVLTATLRGKDIREPGNVSKRIPYWIDYTSFKMNGKTQFDSRKPAWHDAPLRYSQQVKAGETVTIEATWMPHIDERLSLA